jgi:hypothetical protein
MSTEARDYIRHHNGTIATLHKDYSLRFWDLSLDGANEEFAKAFVAAKERYLTVYNNREDFRRLREWKASRAQLDEVEARQLKLIHDLAGDC